MRWRPSAVTAFAAVPAVFSLVGNLATGTVEVEGDWWPPVVWTATGLLVLASIYIEVVRARAGTRNPATSTLDTAANQLATTVRDQWRREERQRKVNDPVALPVSWEPAPKQLVDHWENVQRSPAGSPARPIPIKGRIEQIATIYRRLASGRLVILGPAGAGKTALVTRLALDLLPDAAISGRVPVIVNIGSWNPTSTTLLGWLAAQLIRDYPRLSGQVDGSNMAAALLRDDRILPILDGFDEINPGLRAAALQQLNDAADLPLILTSRKNEYAQATHAADVLTAAAGIELEPLATTDLADYLPRTTRQQATLQDGPAEGIWGPVLTHLRTQPTDTASVVLLGALSTPLMVYLARTVYSDVPQHDPVDLLDTSRYPTREAIEEHLIAAYLPAVYRHPSASGRPWDRDRAGRWLGYLAAHLDRLGTRDLAWWQIRDTIPRTTRGLVFAVTYALAGGFAALGAGLKYGPALGLAFGISSPLFLGLVYGRGLGPAPTRTRLQIRGRLSTIAKTLVVGLMLGFGLGRITEFLIGSTFESFKSPYGITFGLAYGLAFGLNVGLESPVDVVAEVTPATSLINDRRNAIRKALILGAAISIAALVAFGPIAGPLIGLSAGLFLAFSSAWGHWLLLVRIWLPLTGRLPWRIFGFLTDAYRRGVLRQTGAVYQFRHAQLQEHLAKTTSRYALESDMPGTLNDTRIQQLIERLATTSAGRTKPTTLARLAGELAVPVEEARIVLAALVNTGAVRLVRTGPAGTQPVDPASIAEHARFTVSLT